MIVDFWFDPACPYTWITSRWMVEVQRLRPVEVRWNVMSLAILNEGREVNPEDPDGEYGDELEHYLWMPVRICAAVQQRYGHDALGRLYTALGVRFHNRGDWLGIPAALAEAGLPAELAEVAESTQYDDVVRASHAEGIGLVGMDVGTPVIAVPGADGQRIAFFGPVVSPAPRGELAAQLWDGTLLVAGVPGFFELKRTRTAEPSFDNLD
ncbi:MAG: disulfide bond formation protein DsbA [Pseudonocardiaceae bacterium]|nr:disulfide bond formation protein DsbA [Pseudonocardiaceae bacterium]